MAIQLQNVGLTDQIAFPGTVNMPATVSFNIVFSRTGPARHIAPKSHDPVGPFHWLGDMSPATNSGTVSVAYNDGSFSAQDSSIRLVILGRSAPKGMGHWPQTRTVTTQQRRRPMTLCTAGITDGQITSPGSAAPIAQSRLAMLLGE